ncbi:uncharacterized protein RAG0_11944 [Rhynchosporium agropyri]|uniref:Uncharacterized protein n=1 Tax=Rhynchosporium agropyri TaxID=914238 RepID=A0A1E1L914_9HELO|nr:uncharacterized protein RAG0_11944 [Rhynchosporium agropyri]
MPAVLWLSILGSKPHAEKDAYRGELPSERDVPELAKPHTDQTNKYEEDCLCHEPGNIKCNEVGIDPGAAVSSLSLTPTGKRPRGRLLLYFRHLSGSCRSSEMQYYRLKPLQNLKIHSALAQQMHGRSPVVDLTQ